MKTEQLLLLNNERKKQLSKEALKYYEDLQVYIRLAPRKAERAKEEVLLEMLEHLIEAEQNGVEAEAVFGKTPKQLADEIIESLPNEKKSSVSVFWVEIIFLLVGVYITTSGILNALLQKNFEIHIGSAAISLVVLVGGFLVLISFLLKQIQNLSFSTTKKPYIFSSLMTTLYIMTVATTIVFFPGIGKEMAIKPWMMIAIGLFLLGIYFIIKAIRLKNEAKIISDFKSSK